MIMFVLECGSCGRNEQFPTSNVGGRPANPTGEVTSGWSVLFLCPECRYLRPYEEDKITLKDAPRDLDILSTMTFTCGTEGCTFPVTAYTSSATPHKDQNRGEMLLDWKIDSRVLCSSPTKKHTPQNPRYNTVQVRQVYPPD
jgi:hypothetical protein